MYVRYIKRALDVILSALGMVVTAPLLLLICLWIRCDSPGPVLFQQPRVGRGKRSFQIIKFRTMYQNAPEYIPTHLLPMPARYITRCGRLLRKTSLDELPQLINILRGEMSIIGPRPALWNQTDLIAARDARGANDALPGLTGWAQVNGRDQLTISEKARLDGEYAAHITFGMDVRCFLLTLLNVIRGQGVVEGGTGGPDQAAYADKEETRRP